MALEQSKNVQKVLHDGIRTVKRMFKRCYMMALEQSKNVQKVLHDGIRTVKECSKSVT